MGERSGWRDERISRKHREWGDDARITDLDFIVVEYHNYVPMALIEYKEKSANKQTKNNPQYRALINLGNMAGIGVYNVRYEIDANNWFNGIVTPLNKKAIDYLQQSQNMDEIEYIRFLYAIRNIKVPDEIVKRLTRTEK